MSCVALEKAINQNKHIVVCNQNDVGRLKATPAKAAPNNNSIAKIHQRLVLYTSTKGLQRGFNTHGR